MREIVNVPISVTMVFDSQAHRVFPQSILWQGRNLLVTKIGFHHLYRTGRTLQHVYSVACNQLFFRLVLDTQTLHWKLEEIADGLPN